MDGRGAPPQRCGGGGGGGEDHDEELGVFTAERYFNGALAAEDALWCDRSSSSFSSVLRVGRQEGSAPTPTAATSSSEASWNSRSALLPDPPVVLLAPAAESKPSAVAAADERAGRSKPAPTPSSSHSHLRRWLCACAGGDGEESVSGDVLLPDEVAVDPGNVLGGKKRSTEADAMLPARSTRKETGATEEVTTVRVRPGIWADDADPLHAVVAPLALKQFAEVGHRRAANSVESSMRMLQLPTTASSDERRRKSVDKLLPGGQGSTLGSVKPNSSFRIVAGSGVASAAGGGSPDPAYWACRSRRDSGADNAAAPSELDCVYPPSEASVVWSVVTADGAASGNFSSAASGYYHYYHHYNNDGDGHDEAVVAALRNTAGSKSNRRSSNGRIINGGGSLLLGCMSERAVDAVGPCWAPLHRPEVEPAAVARLSAATSGRSGPGVTRRR